MFHLFSFRGRLSRGAFLKLFIPVYIMQSITTGFILNPPETYSIAFILVPYLLTTLTGISLLVRRLHDIGYSGFLLLIPLFNLYLFLLALFKRGDSGINKYGSGS